MTMSMAEIEEYLNSFPPGYKFDPSDIELITEYLLPKMKGKEKHLNLMHVVNIYLHNPDYLAENYVPQGNKGWYFFTSRDRKYPNGSRPNRKAGDGFWKATGADKAIIHNGIQIGSRRALTYYKGRPPKGEKTLWIMHEFQVAGPSQIKKEFQVAESSQVKKRKHDETNHETGKTTMKLDEYVLCRIYKKNQLAPKPQPQKEEEEEAQEVENESPESQVDETMIESESPPKESPVIGDINHDGNMYNNNHPCHNAIVYPNNGVPAYNASHNNGDHNVNVYTTDYNYGDCHSFQPLIGSISTNISDMSVNSSTSYAGLFDWDPYYNFSEDFTGDYINDYEQSILNLLSDPQHPIMADPDPNPDSMGMISARHEVVNLSNPPHHLIEEIEAKDVLPLPPPPPLHTPLPSLPC